MTHITGNNSLFLWKDATVLASGGGTAHYRFKVLADRNRGIKECQR
ncbi:hypothetical protein ABTY63_30965 [Streptomyces solisilvae]|nr:MULTISPECIES: hypothetical protein [unclassified Streptomyces]MCM3804437.1 hypothetical protein [Streptomyces sp. DR7-3]